MNRTLCTHTLARIHRTMYTHKQVAHYPHFIHNPVDKARRNSSKDRLHAAVCGALKFQNNKIHRHTQSHTDTHIQTATLQPSSHAILGMTLII